MTDDSWQSRAACRGVGTSLFYSTEESDARRALSYCGRCEVRQACLDAAIARRDMFGTWGGMSEAERRRLIRRELRRQRAA